jgi:hypothetical protein
MRYMGILIFENGFVVLDAEPGLARMSVSTAVPYGVLVQRSGERAASWFDDRNLALANGSALVSNSHDGASKDRNSSLASLT